MLITVRRYIHNSQVYSVYIQVSDRIHETGYTADCTTVVILLGNRRWPCGLGMNRQFT